MLLFAATILFILFVCIRMSVTTHYFKYYIGEQEVTLFGTTHKYGFEVLASAFNTIGQALAILGVFLVPVVCENLRAKECVDHSFRHRADLHGRVLFFQTAELL